MIREQSQVIYNTSNYNKIASYSFIISTGYLQFSVQKKFNVAETKFDPNNHQDKYMDEVLAMNLC